MPVVSIFCPWCSWGMAIASAADEEATRARAREVVIEHAASAHPERIDEAAQEYASWVRVDE